MRTVGKRLLDMMAKSTLTSGAIAMCLVGTACYMWATGGSVPEQLYALLYGVVAFFFMSKTVKGGHDE